MRYAMLFGKRLRVGFGSRGNRNYFGIWDGSQRFAVNRADELGAD
jgi:hypothetical protein